MVFRGGVTMLMSFSYNGRDYVNFDLDDPNTVNELIADGVPAEFIDGLKNSHQPLTVEERLEAVESAILALMDLSTL